MYFIQNGIARTEWDLSQKRQINDAIVSNPSIYNKLKAGRVRKIF